MKLNLQDIHDLLSLVQILKKKDGLTNEQIQLGTKADLALRQIIVNFDEIHDEIIRLHERVGILKEEKKTEKLDNSFVKMVLAKIDLLKNIIRKATGNEKDEFFSMDVSAVESIEADIISTHSVTKEQMEELNKIYKTYTK